MTRGELPSRASRCPGCDGRGRNFDRERLTLDLCLRCEGVGYVMDDLERFLAGYERKGEED